MPDRKSAVSCNKVEIPHDIWAESDIQSLRVLKPAPVPSRLLPAPAAGGSFPTGSICCRPRDPSPKIKHCHFGESCPICCICCLLKCMHIAAEILRVWNCAGSNVSRPSALRCPVQHVCKAQVSRQRVMFVSDCSPQKCSKYSSYCSNSLKIGQILPLHDTAN